MQTENQATLTTTSSTAAEQLAQGIDGINRWRVDALDHVDAALESDPDFAMAHAVKGLFLAGGRNNRFMPVIEQCLSCAQRNNAHTTPREQAYVRALAALADNRIHRAVLAFEQILQRHPTDLLAHRLLQQELFWMGEARWMRDIAARALPAWSTDDPDFSGFLSVFAFSHEEAGEHEKAERAAREAVERDKHDCWGAHALAHVLEMQGRHREGVAWLEGLSGNWAHANQIVHHLWWHLCLFYLEQNQHERILDLLDKQVRNPDSPLVQAVPDAYIDLQNVASLLMRLELRGVDVGERWQTVADEAAQRIDNHPSPFTSAHAAMILAANGRFAEAEQLVQSLYDWAAADQGSLGNRIQVAAIPAAEAAIAHRCGEYDEVVNTLMPARRDLWRMGGSHAQRDVFLQLLTDACLRLDRRDYLAIVLDDMADLGFAKVSERSLYREAAGKLH